MEGVLCTVFYIQCNISWRSTAWPCTCLASSPDLNSDFLHFQDWLSLTHRIRMCSSISAEGLGGKIDNRTSTRKRLSGYEEVNFTSSVKMSHSWITLKCIETRVNRGKKGICMTELSIKLNKNNVLFVQAYNRVWYETPMTRTRSLKKDLLYELDLLYMQSKVKTRVSHM